MGLSSLRSFHCAHRQIRPAHSHVPFACSRTHFLVAPHPLPLTFKTKKSSPKESFFCFNWSGQWDSDPRHQPWQGCALPLSYTRIICERII